MCARGSERIFINVKKFLIFILFLFISIGLIGQMMGKQFITLDDDGYFSILNPPLDEKELYWQRRNAVPRVKNIYEIIQKWNDLQKFKESMKKK